MRATKASADSESQRMFASDFFEFFSKTPPWLPLAIFVPLILYWVFRSVEVGVSVAATAGLFALGLLGWSLLEYWAHRLIFHYEPSTPFGKRMIWILHGVHHDWPNDKYRLLFPPGLSLPLAGGFFFLFTFAVGEQMRYPLIAGLAAGYLTYDMVHYWTHHFSPRSRFGKYLRKHHMVHHFKHPELGYGVSSPLWDFVFGTMYPDKSGEAADV